MKKTPKKNTLIKSRQRVRDHGEVFTPEHITDFMYKILDVNKDDYILDEAVA